MTGAEIDISPKQDKGVLKEILKEGQGNDTPPEGCKVTVHYTGTLLDGTQFDSSRDRNQPFEFDLGKGSVIKAWDIGVATMKKGEQAILTCAADYAYGATGSPPTIPPGATLKFDVEVISWKGEDLSPDKDGSIEKIQITAGDGYTTPNDEAMVEIHLIGKHGDKVFDERDVSFNIGEGANVNVISGVEKALESFKKGETSRLIIKPKFAFANESFEFNIPSDATVEYTVTLKTFEKAKESWSMDTDEKIEVSKVFKEKGTKYFKDGKLNLAIKMYQKVLSYLEFKKDPESATEEQKALVLSSNLNMALCYLKSNNMFEAKNAATEALLVDPDNEKAHFRKGLALLNIGEAQLAADAFTTVLKIEPTNKSAQLHLNACNKTLKEQLQKEKKIYANMFEKFAKKDLQREEEEKKKQPDVMSSLGEWGKEDREREPSEFEKENPNILLLNGSGEFKDM
ncbi:PREDICTED: FK506-binding protein 59 [Nicrophorus vespilloides]|uniref:peptidylprolyl isomerase n=1 Tax=Nicrophorus vespilloides TaxID=110193 RepID=A0ABM1N8G3_NICVS|nr:PREDICTED: FK506-binding protein 59 [Nicrophorus vespilloides]